MIFLFKVILVYLILAAILWSVCRFIQGVFYLEVPESLWWRSLAGAGVLCSVCLLWPALFNCFDAGKWPINFDDMFFLGDAVQTGETFKELVVLGEGNRETRYRRVRTASGQIEYRDSENRTLPPTPLSLIAVPEQGEGRRFEVIKDTDGFIDRSQGGAFYQDLEGNKLAEAAFCTGETTSNTGQFLLTLFGDLLVLAAWFLVLWLLLLFQWPHALLIALPSVLVWGLGLNLVV